MLTYDQFADSVIRKGQSVSMFLQGLKDRVKEAIKLNEPGTFESIEEIVEIYLEDEGLEEFTEIVTEEILTRYPEMQYWLEEE